MNIKKLHGILLNTIDSIVCARFVVKVKAVAQTSAWGIIVRNEITPEFGGIGLASTDGWWRISTKIPGRKTSKSRALMQLSWKCGFVSLARWRSIDRDGSGREWKESAALWRLIGWVTKVEVSFVHGRSHGESEEEDELKWLTFLKDGNGNSLFAIFFVRMSRRLKLWIRKDEWGSVECELWSCCDRVTETDTGPKTACVRFFSVTMLLSVRFQSTTEWSEWVSYALTRTSYTTYCSILCRTELVPRQLVCPR